MDSLTKVDELFAKSHCLCLCEEDYFDRSWCLLEVSVNTFNIGSRTLINENQNVIDEARQAKYPVLSWLTDARLVQQMGYIHALKFSHRVNGTPLEMPMDLIHLKSQLRALLLTSHLTNQGDRRIIINLFDSLVRAPH